MMAVAAASPLTRNMALQVFSWGRVDEVSQSDDQVEAPRREQKGGRRELGGLKASAGAGAGVRGGGGGGGGGKKKTRDHPGKNQKNPNPL